MAQNNFNMNRAEVKGCAIGGGAVACNNHSGTGDISSSNTPSATSYTRDSTLDNYNTSSKSKREKDVQEQRRFVKQRGVGKSMFVVLFLLFLDWMVIILMIIINNNK